MRRLVTDRFRTVLAIVLTVLLAMQHVPARAVADEVYGTPGPVIGIIDACMDLLGLANEADKAGSQQVEVTSSEVVEGVASEVADVDASQTDVAANTETMSETQDSTQVVATVTDTYAVTAEPAVASNEVPDSVCTEPTEPETMESDAFLEESCYDMGTLTSSLMSADSRSFAVSLNFTSDARIPVGSRLVVKEIVDGTTETDLLSRVEATLGLGTGERILDTRLLAASIEVEGRTVVPAADVTLTIESDAISSSRSSFTEVVHLADDDAVTAVADEVVECTTYPIEGRPSASDVPVTGLHSDESVRASATKVCFSTSQLGTFALASVAARTQIQELPGLSVWLLLPRRECSVSVLPTDVPELEEGVEALGCHTIAFGGISPDDATVLVEALPSDDGVSAEDAVEGLSCHLVDERGVVSEDVLFGPEGTSEPIPFDCAHDSLLLVKDTGYRNSELRMDDVTVSGLMPRDAEGTTRDVTADYDEVPMAPVAFGTSIVAQQERDDARFSALAAYDITLTSKGKEYQPDEQHPLTVTLENPVFSMGLDLEVLHIQDDGSIERVEDFEHTEGRISFTATGFSTYLVAQEDDSTQTGRSATFILRACGRGYARASTVTFVDNERSPILGTVTNEQRVDYTGSGAEPNETNTIDLYDFIDRIAPEIADEYEFSRVYMTLLQNNEKNFRYVQVGDGTAIGESANNLRAYFNMSGVAENAPGRDYYGTWYNLVMGGRMDDIYIEYYHVAPASFCSIDTRNDPVGGAEFALFTDANCYKPFEYKNEEVSAVSDASGLVTFGKIPRGTYYMKETVIPDGYKRSTDIYKVVVDGQTAIQNVVHEDDDGSIIIADVLRMRLTKEWEDGSSLHANDSVIITVYADGHVVDEVELNAENGWTQTLNDLDPNKAYMVSETCVYGNGAVVTKNWIPEIVYKELDPHVEYYKAEDFRQGKQYIILTSTVSGTRSLVGDTSLTTIPLTANDYQITGDVTDDMLWTVDTITKDGILALQNVASGKYLDMSNKWYLNATYPVPLYVHHTNDDGKIKFYHRANINAANSYYLYIWYGPQKEGQVDRYMNDESRGATFEVYRKVNVRSVDVTITNKVTRYPIAIRNVRHPDGAALPDVTFDLYGEEGYDAAGTNEPLMGGLRANGDGYLVDDGGEILHELGAGTYYLCRTSNLEEEGYSPLAPIKFTITRGGALKVAQEDQEVPGFTYCSQGTFGSETCPVLQVPNLKGATLEVSLDIEGAYADLTREFGFRLQMPEGVSEIEGTVDGVAVTFTSENDTFTLAHGQTVCLREIPSTVPYVLTQTSDRVAERPVEGDGLYAATVSVDSGDETATVTQAATDARVITFKDLKGSASAPVRVTITNTLSSFSAPATGIHDNASAWVVVVAVSLVALGAVAYGNRSRRKA